MRLVVEQNETDAVDLKKDTERADEIKAMKQAWEAAEPGRAIKVTGSCFYSICNVKTTEAQQFLPGGKKTNSQE